ncbi:WD40 repeat domain-containing protein [Pseudorhodoplanes sp.]|uniref:WD40 repeat domain-containing protein n=1 Tax=Pseudorhodoplanes sp. TaxID=1934341 RepID=UPI003D11E21A
MRLTRIVWLFSFVAALFPGISPPPAAAKTPAPSIVANFFDLQYADDAIFSPDARILAVATASGGVTLWDLSSGLPLRTLMPRAYLTGTAFTRDGKRVVTAHKDGAVRLWDAESGAVLHAMRAPPRAEGSEPEAIIGLTMDRSGEHIITSEFGPAATVWSISGRKQLLALPHAETDRLAKAQQIKSGRITADGSKLILLVSRNFNETDAVSIHDAKTGAEIAFFDLPENHIVVDNGFVGDDELVVLVSGADCEVGELKLFSLKERAVTAAIHKPALCTKPKDDEDRKPLRLHASPDSGRVLISQESDPNLRIFDVATRKMERTVRLPDGAGTRVLGVSRDLGMVAIGEEGSIAIRALDTGALVKTLRSFGVAADLMAFSADGTRVMIQAERRGTDDAVSIGIRPLDALQGSAFTIDLPAAVRLEDFAAAPLLALGSKDGEILLLSLEGKHAPRRFSIAPLTSAKFARLSADGKTAIVNGTIGADDGPERTFVIDLASGAMHELPVASTESEMTGLVVSPDGGRIAAGFRDGSAQILDIASARLLKKLPPYKQEDGDSRPLAFSPDGTLLAGGSTFDDSVFVWNLGTGKLMRTITLPDSLAGYRVVTAVALSHDRKMLAAGLGQRALSSGDIGTETGGILVFDLGSGKLRFTLRGHRGAITALAFSKDGKSILSGSYDGTLRSWDRASGKPLATAAMDPQGRWLVLTEAGFYSGPENSDHAVSLVRGMKAVPAATAQKLLSRADLVSELLKGDPAGQYRAAARRLDLSKHGPAK